jgi:hypothetical protein
MALYELEQKLNRQKNRIGLVGGRLKLRETTDAQEPISAHIDPQDWHIEITLKQGYNPVRDKRTQKYAVKRNITNALEKICEDVLYHECGHWELPRGSGKGCPYDETHHDRVLESITGVLAREGKQSLAGYVANAFEDVLDNLNCKQHTNHAGQVLFWNEQGMTHGKYTKFYEAFVKLNLALWGDKTDTAFLRKWHANKAEVVKAVKSVLSVWNVPKDLKGRIAALYDKNRWPMLAAQFTEAMLPLLDEHQQHQLFGVAVQAPGTSVGDGQGGSAFDKKLGTPEGQEKASHARYQAGTGHATNRDSFEQLDALYRRLARNIPVEVETFTKAYTFPLVPYGREPFVPEQHDLLQRKAKIGLQEDGSVGLMVNKDWIPTQEAYKQNIRKFPRFRLAVLDTSESMKEAPDGSRNIGRSSFIPWGDNSKYHYALLGYYGIERFLQSQHIAPYADAGAINFSKETIVATGPDARKLLLMPQFGGTVLDANKLGQHVSKGDTFLLSLSDGEIQNWDNIRDAYRAVVSGCAAAHIQIGGQNMFSADLERWGVPVYYVQGNEDLARLMVRVASDKYKSHAKVAR